MKLSCQWELSLATQSQTSKATTIASLFTSMIRKLNYVVYENRINWINLLLCQLIFYYFFTLTTGNFRIAIKVENKIYYDCIP